MQEVACGCIWCYDQQFNSCKPFTVHKSLSAIVESMASRDDTQRVSGNVTKLRNLVTQVGAFIKFLPLFGLFFQI